MKPKPKVTRKPGSHDNCQTPPYAVEPLLPYLNKNWVIWEPAAGEGILSRALMRAGFKVFESDILTGTDFLTCWVPACDVIVTNPPYSRKFEWLERCYELRKPFALLLPVDTLGTAAAQRLFNKYSVQVFFMSRRIDFKMPEAGWLSKGGAWFPVAWFTYGLASWISFSLMKFIDIEKTDKYELHKLDEDGKL